MLSGRKIKKQCYNVFNPVVGSLEKMVKLYKEVIGFLRFFDY